MASFKANTRWALTTPILDRFQSLLHIHVADDIMYHRANRGDDKSFSDVSLHYECRGVRRRSWWMCVVCCGCW